jgi:hypothetical protein
LVCQTIFRSGRKKKPCRSVSLVRRRQKNPMVRRRLRFCRLFLPVNKIDGQKGWSGKLQPRGTRFLSVAA